MEIVMNTAKESQSMKKQLADLLVAISWADLENQVPGYIIKWTEEMVTENQRVSRQKRSRN